MNWYAILTQARHEKKVAQRLLAFGFETFLPLRREIHQWADRKQAVFLPLFPSYVFVLTDKAGLVKVAQISGVVDPRSSYGRAQLVTPEEMLALRRLTLAGRDEVHFNEEHLVLISSGALSGITATLQPDGTWRMTLGSTDLSFSVRQPSF